MSNYEFRPEPEGEVARSAPSTPHTPPKLSPQLALEISLLDAAERLRRTAAPQNPEGQGDYISMT
jgi:hypothetical protein